MDGKELRLAAKDLAGHLACRHLTELDREVAEGRRAGPQWRDPALALLQARGLAHERAYVAYLRETGLGVVDSGTLMAPWRSSELGWLCARRWRHRSSRRARREVDRPSRPLLRVPKPSALGAWSYEVVDTKLGQETRSGTVLQLCLYSNLVGQIQERVPTQMHVVKPGDGFPRETFRFADFQAYYRLVRRQLEEILAVPPSGSTYPDPVPHCDICRWWRECDAKRHDDDHLCLITGLRSLHMIELKRAGDLRPSSS